MPGMLLIDQPRRLFWQPLGYLYKKFSDSTVRKIIKRFCTRGDQQVRYRFLQDLCTWNL